MALPVSKLDQEQIIKSAFDEANQRLRVDATLTASIGDVSIVDANTGDPMTVNPDGSINTNVTGSLQIEVSAADGDNIAISDGTNTLVVNPDGSINVDTANLTFASDKVDASGSTVTLNNGAGASAVNIQDGGNSITVDAADLDIRDLAFATDKVDVSGSTVILDPATIIALGDVTVENGPGAAAVNIQDGGNSITVDATDLDIRNLTFAADKVDVTGSAVALSAPALIAGTDDGLSTGNVYGFVYNPRQQVLDSQDRVDTYTYADFGTINQRITRIDYTSAIFSGIVIRREFNYVLVGTRYKRTDSVWSVI